MLFRSSNTTYDLGNRNIPSVFLSSGHVRKYMDSTKTFLLFHIQQWLKGISPRTISKIQACLIANGQLPPPTTAYDWEYDDDCPYTPLLADCSPQTRYELSKQVDEWLRPTNASPQQSLETFISQFSFLRHIRPSPLQPKIPKLILPLDYIPNHTLEQRNLQDPKHYRITPKADGQRILLIIFDHEVLCCDRRAQKWFRIACAKVHESLQESNLLTGHLYVFDCELIIVSSSSNSVVLEH